jgi:HK97 family phage prohead protease
MLDEERRDLAKVVARLEIRKDDDGNERFDGHAAVFDQRTAIGNPLRWGFYEEVAPGAFSKTLNEGDARMLIDHDSYYVVSRKSAGTLRLNEDGIGLHTDSALDTTLSYVADLKANLRNGNITGMSFGFYVVKDDWSEEQVEAKDSNGDTVSVDVEIRRILEVRLIEVSAVTFPAYPQTDAGLRAVVRALRSRGEDEGYIQQRIGVQKMRSVFDLDLLKSGKDTTVETNTDANVESELDFNVDDTVESNSDDGVASGQVEDSEPARTTPGDDEDREADEAAEPAETTRNAPTERELAAARLKALRAQLRRVA